eukprot:6937431-Ditylum_brightwellii.AAC.1
MEMYHHIFKYHEIYTDLCFKNIPTVVLELKSASERQTNDVDGDVDNGAHNGSIFDGIRHSLDLDKHRQHTANELLILDDVAMSKLSIDSITQFSLRPPELRSVIDKLGIYYCWFSVGKKKLTAKEISTGLSANLKRTILIDGLQ